MTDTWHCRCRCHQPLGESHPAGVWVTDPVEAAAACDQCKNAHSVVFSSFEPPKQWSPDSDATGEGAE